MTSLRPLGWNFKFKSTKSSDNDSHCLAPAHRDRHILDADGNRVAPDNALVEHLDLGAFDETELDQPAFEFRCWQRGTGLARIQPMDHPGKAAFQPRAAPVRSPLRPCR